MPLVPRRDEWLASISLPELSPVPPLKLASGDVVFLCAGFEERSLALLRRCVESGSRGFDVVAFEYLPALPENRSRELSELTSKAGANIYWVKYDRQGPADVTEHVGRAAHHARVFLDTSGMSRLLIVQLVAGLLRAGLASRSLLVYAEAESYPPTQAEVQVSLAKQDDVFEVLHFVSAGVFGILSPPELSTTSMYGQPIRLIVFPTFNPSQFAALRAEIHAASFTIIHGVPPRPENEWRRDAISQLNRVDSIREAEVFKASTLDYRETVKLLLETYAKHGVFEKLVVAPTGSKMQAVAVGIVAAFLSDLQVVYPAPRSFPAPENYTRGTRAIYALPLAPFQPAAVTS